MKKTLLLALAAAGFLSLPWIPSVSVEAAKSTVSTTSKAKQEGWVTEGDLTYYYEDGKMVTGFVTIDGKNYFFNTQTGEQQTGFVVYKGKKYFYSTKTGVQRKGFVTYQGNTYYFGKKGYALKGLQKIGKYRYHFNAKGIMSKNTLVRGKYYAGPKGRFLTGWQTYNGQKYYFSKKNYKALTGWQSIKGKMYFFNADGTLQTLSGVQTAGNGHSYYFDPTTGVMTKGWVTVGENTYYFSTKTGRATKGWKAIDGKKYYFDTNGILQKSQFIADTYYVNENGERVYGWQTINEKTYYFETKKGKMLSEGWHTIDGQKYYFLSDHTLAKSVWINDNQYIDENGSYASGWKVIDGKTYYFNTRTHKKITGWKRISGTVYYFNADGSMKKLSGLVTTTSGARYYYDATTGEMVTGWVTHGKYTYYFSPKNGKALKKWQTIDGKTYYFTSSKGIMKKNAWVSKRYLGADGVMLTSTWVGKYYVGADGYRTGQTRTTGLFTENGNTYYLDENYEKQTGWQTIGDKTYHFDTTTGIMDKNKWVDGYYLDTTGARTTGAWTTINGVNYLFLENGQKATGLVEYQGSKFYFSTTNGAQQTGFKVIDNVTYYFNPAKNGAMAINEDIEIDGIYYAFDSQGHMTAKIDATMDEALGQKIAAYAQTFIGYPYVWGGDKDLTKGVDCSGFTMLVMKHFGITIPRTTWTQHDGVKGYKQPIRISVENLKPGDLIFYYAGNTHVGIYIGDGKIVHASNSAPYPQGGIKISSYDYTYIYGCVRYWYT